MYLAGPELPPLHSQREFCVHALGKAPGCGCQHPKSYLDYGSKSAELAPIWPSWHPFGVFTLGTPAR